MTGLSEHKKQLVWTGRCLADLLTRLGATVDKWAKDIEDEPSPFSTATSTLRHKGAARVPSQGAVLQPSDKPADVEAAPVTTDDVKPRSPEPRNSGTAQPPRSARRNLPHPGFTARMSTHLPQDVQLNVPSHSSTGSSCPIVDLVRADADRPGKKRQLLRRSYDLGADRHRTPAVVKGEAGLIGADTSRQYATSNVKRRRVRNDWTTPENAILYTHIQRYPFMEENELVTRVASKLEGNRTKAQTKSRFRYLLASGKILKSDSTPPKWVLSAQLTTWLSSNGEASPDLAVRPIRPWRRRYSCDPQQSHAKSERGMLGLLCENRFDGSSDEAF
ncbi:hypothetical protein BWQ96_01032 [Gracilariopsis chorda]|uniref:Myb-like domain-containing protein n=1 Tax=Gracilariopsis chorda TaxID=448386 RepID=A0A2V3J4K8_9FLOR|nr:hypothetical protein BWQ96_01032 [Gracilariopsis chorda]|eukprot:PXF49243.1 hypothetical protein BWQ96_01032 [Gracilariopsis chorda]